MYNFSLKAFVQISMSNYSQKLCNLLSFVHGFPKKCRNPRTKVGLNEDLVREW